MDIECSPLNFARSANPPFAGSRIARLLIALVLAASIGSCGHSQLNEARYPSPDGKAAIVLIQRQSGGAGGSMYASVVLRFNGTALDFPVTEFRHANRFNISWRTSEAVSICTDAAVTYFARRFDVETRNGPHSISLLDECEGPTIAPHDHSMP